MPNIFDQMAASDAAAGAPAQAQAGNVFDQMAQQDRQSQDGAMQAALGDAVKILPDQAANDQQMAKTLGLPVDMVERNRDQVQQQFRLRELQQVMQASPVLRAQMSNPDFARVAHDDAPVLNDLEQVMQFLGRSGKATLAGVAGINEGLWGLGRAASGYIPDAAGGRLLEDWTTYGNQQARGVVQRLMPQAGGTVEAGWYSGMQSLGMNLGQLPLAFLPGGQAPLAESIAGQVATRMSPVLWSMGLTTGGQAYGEARDKGLTQAQAIMFGTLQGVIEARTEMIGMPALFDVLKPGKTAAKIMEYMIKEQGGEQIATALQDLNEWAVLPENQGKSFGDYLRARPSAALQTAIATAVGGGAQVTLMKGAGMVLNRAEYAVAKAQQAEAQAALLEQLNKVAQASSLQKRDAETFGALAEQQAAEYGASDTVYIDGNALMQSGLAQQVAQVSPAVAAQVQEAAATGGLVAIPTSEYAARIAPLQESAQLLDHLKFDPEGFTRAEAQVYMQTQGEQLQAEVERALTVAEQTDAARAGMESVRAQVLDQLNAANRFKPEVNGAYASLIAARYAVRAEQMGVTASELFAQRRLRIGSQQLNGMQFDQGQNDQTDDVDEATGLPLNADGTVTVYHHTSAEKAAKIRQTGFLRSAGEPDLYFTTRADTDTGYGDTAIAVRVKPERLALDDEFPGGRADFRVAAPSRVRRLRFLPDGSAVLNQSAVALKEAQTRLPRAAFHPSTNTITLLDNADLTSFLHESAHFFFENDIALASEILAAQHQGASITAGEQQILDDVGTLLTWHGLKGDLSQQLAEWHGLGFEERRAYHEKTAESFERYLLEGKAPSLELTPVFQRFRTWLVSVYRSLKDFVAGHPAAGELSPEVRQVFDRMLASEDQIALALQGRSLVPMFASAEEAGMTPEEFARYQESGRQATADAVDSLQARGIRDMQWLRNARSRMLKAKQKEAAGLRAELETDARVEVYGEPIYRAWRFLTAKLREEDKLPEPVKTGTGQTLDPGKDSLLEAVAKLGGLDRESAAEHLGVHADDFKAKSGVFGAPVFRKTGGLTADAMAERLVESGYLKADDALNVLEDKIASELRGDPQYRFAKDWAAAQGEQRAGDGVDVSTLGAARLDAGELAVMGLPPEVVNTLKARKMVAANGLHPDLVAEQFGFTSGDELVRKLALAEPPQERIDALVDVRMLEQHGELSSPDAIERATDEAIHNEARMRMVATEEATLAKATGKPRVLENAAREYAAQLIARQKVRDLRPSQYTNAESRAAAEAAKARKAGDTARAAAEKRNQLLQGFIASTALKARDEMQQAVDYLRRFDKPSKTLDKDYADQIDQLLERFDLKPVSNKESEKRMALSRWMDSQREQGLEPEIPQELLDAAERKPWRELTVEEMRGLVDTVKQIEHLGRLKHRLLTARDQKAYEAVRDEIAASIREHAGKRKANARTSTTWAGKALAGVKMFGASHIKAATWARVLDGGKDGGPMWEHFVRGANERGDMEATMRAEATSKLAEIMAPLFKLGRMSDKGTFFPTVGRSFNRQERLAIALNIGNDGNLQRLLGGEGWTVDQLKPVLQSLTAAEWHAVQAIWDHFETYRPQIAAKERRVYGKEPTWVEPRAFDVTTADGQNVSLRGGYYPIKYDPAASQRAEEHADAEGAQRQLRGAYTSATTRRSFTKARVEEVNGRPLLYSLAGVYGGVNDVIHDLAWHEWLIDTNRLLRSQTIDSAIRDHYGPEAKQQLKTWAQDIAEGDRGAQHALDMALGRLRQGISVAGLGFNFVSAAMQPLGITQSIVRVGAPWIGRGVMRYVANPVRATREANQLSTFMENRARTRFRELNELRNQVQDQNAVKEFTGRWAYWMMMRFQQMVDVPTWWGAYDKAMAEGNADERSRALADQAVIDSQGGGETKDLSAIERGGSAQRLFTVFYSFMNTALNLGVAQGMTANTPAKKAKLAVDMLLLYTVPAVLGALFKDAITPGDGGDDDPEKLARKLAAEQLSFLMGLFVVGREFADVGKIIAGAEGARDYQGPAGVRLVGDTYKFGKQAMQGEFDDAFRKAAINLSGDLFGLPAAQVNRTWTGVEALSEGKTQNPAAIAFGFQEQR